MPINRLFYWGRWVFFYCFMFYVLQVNNFFHTLYEAGHLAKGNWICRLDTLKLQYLMNRRPFCIVLDMYNPHKFLLVLSHAN